MEIGGWLCFLFINCFFIQYLGAKTVSLNELIAAESKLKQPAENHQEFTDQGKEEVSSSIEILTAETTIKRMPKRLPRLRLPGLLKHSPLIKHLETKAKIQKLKLATLSNIEKLSPLRIRKAFEIKSPLKPKKLKLPRRSRHKRKNQSKKREINENVHLKPQHIPVLKSLSMLFDNLLHSDTSDSYEINSKKYKRNRYYSEELFEPTEDSPDKVNSRFTENTPHKKTADFPSPISAEVSSNTKNLTSSEDYDYSGIRPHQSVPILLPRNTISSRRDYNGTSKGSGTTLHGDFEGNITRNHGDYEHNTRCGENETCEESNENNTNSTTRNDSSGIRHSRGNRFNVRKSQNREISNGNKSKNEDTNDDYRENQLQTRGNETESENSVREPARRLRGFLPKDKIISGIVQEPIQFKEVCEESILNATDISTSNKRIIDKGSPHTTEDEKIRTRNETMILIERNSSQGTSKKVPVVMIFDGYSVTRDKNGENKVSGKTIHFRS